MDRNRVEIDARVVHGGELRHTPGGVAVVELRLTHRSEQTEAGRRRSVEWTFDAVGFGDSALPLTRLKAGDGVRLVGFLERRGLRDPHPVMHITQFELIQGAENAFLPS